MTDLFTATREHDLPPRWNGRVVLWEPWAYPTPIRICGPAARQRDSCSKCGSTCMQEHAVGNLAHKRSTTLADIEGRIRSRKVGMVAYRDLYAFRCHDCKQDVVWQMSVDRWWDLDLTDYSDRGSVDPGGRF